MKKSQKLLIMFVVFCSLLFAGNTVTASAAKKVQLNKTKVTITAGKTTTLKVNNTSKKVTWSTSNKKIATISKKGVVTAKKAGKATITAKVNGKKYTCKITVKAAKTEQEKVLAKYIKALNEKDYKTVMKCHDPAFQKELKEYYNYMKDFYEEAGESYTMDQFLEDTFSVSYIDPNMKASYKALNSKKIDSKHSKIKVSLTMKLKIDKTDITAVTTDWMYFIKVDGKWYLDSSKS